METAAALADDNQRLGLIDRPDRGAVDLVHVYDARHIGARRENAAVEIIAGRLHLESAMAQHVAFVVEGRERRCRDLVPPEPLRVHQERVGAGNAKRDVIEGVNIPAEMMGDAEDRRELDAKLLLLGADLAIQRHAADP